MDARSLPPSKLLRCLEPLPKKVRKKAAIPTILNDWAEDDRTIRREREFNQLQEETNMQVMEFNQNMDMEDTDGFQPEHAWISTRTWSSTRTWLWRSPMDFNQNMDMELQEEVNMQVTEEFQSEHGQEGQLERVQPDSGRAQPEHGQEGELERVPPEHERVQPEHGPEEQVQPEHGQEEQVQQGWLRLWKRKWSPRRWRTTAGVFQPGHGEEAFKIRNGFRNIVEREAFFHSMRANLEVWKSYQT